MHIMASRDKYTKKKYNSLNDIRVEGSYMFELTSGTYFRFFWDTEEQMWIWQPYRCEYSDIAFIQNDELLVRINTPEEKGVEAQCRLKDMSNSTFANDVLRMMEYMSKKCKPPACNVKLTKIRNDINAELNTNLYITRDASVE